ncbi:MAG TPA: DUF4350 domain-containing protein [Coriobacteriia bacterium]|nr:DUF4350 domain-containing protein [Coriobacteriia bacterium]
MTTKTRFFLASLLCLTLAVSGCKAPTPGDSASTSESATSAQEQQSPPTAELPAAPQVAPGAVLVFDMAHGEIFGPDDTTELGQSRAIERMKQAGFDVRVNTQTINADTLANATGLMIAGPMRPLTREEYIAVNDFIERGGTLLLTIHVPFPVLAVPAHWGLPVTPFVMASEAPVPGMDAGVFVADEIEKSYLTEGVSRVFVVSGWPVATSSKNASTPVKSGRGTWIDADNSGSQEPSETASFGIVGSATVGKGHVIVTGDDAIFANIAINEADNVRLLDNILRLMSGAVGV